MNRLLVQYYDNKFIHNVCSVSLPDTIIKPAVFDTQLYKLYFTYEPTHIIFVSNKITQECAQFIEDYGSSNIRIYIYHENEQMLNALQNYPEKCLHLIPDVFSSNIPKEYDSSKIIYIPNNLINTEIYFSDQRKRNDSIVYFAPKQATSLPIELVKILYPNTTLPIKIFNASKISHPQNLGMVTELEKGELLRNNRYYLTYTQDLYLLEAIECGCTIVNFDNAIDYNNAGSVFDKNKTKTIKYQDFLQGVINV